MFEGNAVVIWLSDAGARQFLGLERPGDEKSRWAALGKVAQGGLTALGLWLMVERIEERAIGAEAKVKKTWSVSPQTCLIRTEFIISAQLFNTYPKEVIGFKENIFPSA
jgi:hypothetical protein